MVIVLGLSLIMGEKKHINKVSRKFPGQSLELRSCSHFIVFLYFFLFLWASPKWGMLCFLLVNFSYFRDSGVFRLCTTSPESQPLKFMFMCFLFPPQGMTPKTHINMFLPPTQSRDNPPNLLFVYMCFFFPRSKSSYIMFFWSLNAPTQIAGHPAHSLSTTCCSLWHATCHMCAQKLWAGSRSSFKCRSGPTIVTHNRAGLRTLFGSQGLT